MSKMHFTVSKFMTPNPKGVNVAETLEHAASHMTKEGIRHLPVIRDGVLVGVISDRDIQVAKAFKHGNLKTMIVEDVVEEDVYVTHPDSNLRTVALEMAERKIGSAVVVEADKPVGIFTTSDACRALSEALS